MKSDSLTECPERIRHVRLGRQVLCEKRLTPQYGARDGFSGGALKRNPLKGWRNVGGQVLKPQGFIPLASGLILAFLFAGTVFSTSLFPRTGWAKPLIPPLEVKILDAEEKQVGKAQIYLNYIELETTGGTFTGAIGVVVTQGRAQLFLVKANKERQFIGWAENYRLYDTNDKLVGYYYWTAIWSYVYDPQMKKVGQAQCIAYQGVCAAGIAGFLLGLL